MLSVRFTTFKSGDIDVRNKVRGRPPKKYKNVEFQALLDEDDNETQYQMTDHLGVFHK